MPYLQVDLDAKKNVPKVARAARVPVGDVAWGLLELWEYAWLAEASAAVSELVLAGCFGEAYGPALRDALVEWRFLEPVDGGFRVRGLDRYSKADEARSRGGRAAAGNLIPGGPKAAKRAPKAAPGVENARLTSADPRLDLGCSRASAEPQPSPSPAPASAEARVNLEPRTKKETTPPTRVRADAGSGSLLQRIEAQFLEARGSAYALSLADEQASRRLLQLAAGDEDEVCRRWALALARQRFPTCSSLADLARHWNAYAAPETTPAQTAGNGTPSGARPVSLVRPSVGGLCAQAGCQRPSERDSFGVGMCGDHAAASDAFWRQGAAQ